MVDSDELRLAVEVLTPVSDALSCEADVERVVVEVETFDSVLLVSVNVLLVPDSEELNCEADVERFVVDVETPLNDELSCEAEVDRFVVDVETPLNDELSCEADVERFVTEVETFVRLLLVVDSEELNAEAEELRLAVELETLETLLFVVNSCEPLIASVLVAVTLPGLTLMIFLVAPEEPTDTALLRAPVLSLSVEFVPMATLFAPPAEKDVDLLVRQNIQPTLALLDWCSRAAKPLIYASSAATYGDGETGFKDDESPGALARLRPLNAYGWSKHVVDRRIARLKAAGEKLPPQTVGLKFFNVFGPNEHHKGGMRSVIATNYAKAARGEAVRLFRSRHPGYPDGGQLRDFIYVRDCVEIMLWFKDNPAISGLFNAGTGQARSWWELAKAMFAAVHRPCVIELMDMPAEMSATYQYYTQADIGKLRRAGFDRPFTTLEDGVHDYIANYLAMEDIHL